MAINTYQIPNYQYYNGEANYVSPAEADKETLARIKNRKTGAKVSEIFLG